MGGRRSGGESSSDEEEEDPKWKAAIESIAATTVFGAKGNSKSLSTRASEEDGDYRFKPKKLTHAEIKALKVLDEMVEKTLEFVKDPLRISDIEPENDNGVRLFKRAPVGIIFDHLDEIEGPKKKPKLLPNRVVDENSKEFKKRLKSIAVDGSDILAAAREAARKSSARLEAKAAAAKAKAKTEEERVAGLKRVRGEKWLPSVAREMQLNKSLKRQSAKPQLADQ
ncbi:PREDICTED: uncharacterized protein LOC104827599 [Tarenaya hassleriana]|uniref:uncharacterized protein LOC104827599 n=1 Tax=Tarenaya hassleriana TaxID=28532 RepID=UPI00053C0AE7|nr:PREDICTED: uncharacterized protein LOC104827599 [Tarenaya hassleriana]